MIAVKWDLVSLYSSQGEPLLSQGPLRTLILDLALVSRRATSDSQLATSTTCPSVIGRPIQGSGPDKARLASV